MWGCLQRGLRRVVVLSLLVAIVAIVISPFVELPPTLRKKAWQYAMRFRVLAGFVLAALTSRWFLPRTFASALPVLHLDSSSVLLC